MSPRTLLRSTAFLVLAYANAALAGIPTTVYVNSTIVCDYPTIQAAVDDLSPGSEIRLVGDEFLLSSSLNILNRNLTIAGGYPACGAPDATDKTTLRADFADSAVISAVGNNPGELDLRLVDLTITNGNNPSGSGGGMRILGQGQVTLVAVDVQGNIASFGGGLYANANSGPLGVNLIAGTRIGGAGIAGNLAEATGGGVFCSGARIRLGHADIISNVANNRGGGLFGSSCEVFSTDDNGDLRIEHNQAREGGGIFANNQSELILNSRPTQKISISHNLAVLGEIPRAGGGIYLSGVGTRLDGNGLRIDGNLARSHGGGIVVLAAEAYLGRGTNSCTTGDDACSSLSGNEVRDEAGALAGFASAAWIVGSGTPILSLAHTRVASNSAAGSTLRVSDGSLLELTNILMVLNHSENELLNNGSTGVLRADFVTIADNSIGGAMISNTSTAPLALEISRSILMTEEGQSHITGAGATMFSCLNTGPGGALGGTDHPPGFLNAAAGNYLLRSTSENLDQCSIDGSEPAVDLAGRPRVVDSPGIPNAAGPADRGTYEDFDDLFTDRFEG